MTDQALVSVVVPVFNAGTYLEDCIRSITSQTYRNLEIIVVDDGSTDTSPQVIHRFSEADPRIRSLRQPNSGVSAARNAGIAAARGKYVAFVDADDWIEPNTYEVMVHALEHRGVDFVTCGYFIDSPDESHLGPFVDTDLTCSNTRDGMASVLATRNRFAVTRVYRRDIIGPVAFRPDIHWGEDTVFVLEVASRATSSVLLPDRLYHYIQTPESATRSAFNEKRWSGIEMTHVLENIVGNDPEMIGHVLATRVGIIGILLRDMHASPPIDRAVWRELTRIIRSDLYRIVESRWVSQSIKLKATLMAISPRAFVQARNMARLHTT